MRIGMTYDLRDDYLKMGYTEDQTAEFDREGTILAIAEVLGELGHEVDRIGHVRALVNRLAAGDTWDLVFNICEGLSGFGREAQVPALLEAYGIPCTFSDSLINALTLHKGFAKQVVVHAGFPTPDFAIVETPADVEKVDLPYPLFVKPVAEGTGKGVHAFSRVQSPEKLMQICVDVIGKYRQPALVETFLPGREFTVGIVGTGDRAEVVGVLEVILRKDAEAHAYSYVNKENCEELVTYRLTNDEPARKCAEYALGIWRAYGCRDAGRMDFRCDAEGVPNYLEVNPLAGLHPEHSDLPIICTKAGISYHDLIARIIESATQRVAPR
ncbi:D-alanine--D-alanine ligase [Myxococcota bacterium]|nr:D-alanine--D-alanine ligase [Myxococcota bacterium]MBU1412086.1 D-alanine--D-alanine ligase [Myxococcota bacterium]MBU1510042.1 D-alanine--D-alanine ligase [Myxococcota bacterium]